MSIEYAGNIFMMGTPQASKVVRDTLSYGDIIDGIDDQGNEVIPSQEVLDTYDKSIRDGDMAFVEWMLQTYGHYEVPILNEDPISILDSADHGILLLLDDQEYTVLPDIVKAILYDDPIYLDSRKIDYDLVLQIFKNDAFEIYNVYKKDIIRIVTQICSKDIFRCGILLKQIQGSIKDDILKDQSFQSMLSQLKFSQKSGKQI